MVLSFFVMGCLVGSCLTIIWAIKVIEQKEQRYEQHLENVRRIHGHKPQPLTLATGNKEYESRFPRHITEESLVSDGYQVANGPDHASCTVLYQGKPVAHFWWETQWFNLIGRPDKGRGLSALVGYLERYYKET